MSGLVAFGLTRAAMNSLSNILLNRDVGVIESGGHKMIMAKQDLQELENYINDASFFLAVKRSTSNHRNLQIWITKAQKDAFYLEDKIAMHAIHRFNKLQVYMKSTFCFSISNMKPTFSFRWFSIHELTQNIKNHKSNMPTDLQSSGELMAGLPAILPFIRNSQCDYRLGDTKLFGMDGAIGELKKGLLEGVVPVIFVVGEQQSGKTTLMNKVYEDSEVKNYFSVRSKVDVSQARGLVELLRAVLKHDGREANAMDPDAIDEFKIMEEIHHTFKRQGHHYLIVLDHVEDTSILYILEQALRDCQGKIVCLTRNNDIHKGNRMVLQVPSLERDDQIKLLVHSAFRESDGTPGPAVDLADTNGDDLLHAALEWKTRMSKNYLGDIVKTLNSILAKCRGNPWNIRTIGALLDAHPVEKWKEIEGKVDTVVMGNEKRDPFIELEDAKLPQEIRLGFLYCLAFPQGSEITENSGIPAQKLIRLWTAEGFLQDSPLHSQEQEAEDLLQKLIDKKLLVVKKRGFDGKVIKCSVNEHIRPIALKMCELQKFCRFMPGAAHQEMEAGSTNRINLNLLRGSRGTALSHRYRMLAVHGDEGVQEAAKELRKDIRMRTLLYFRTSRMGHSKLELSFGHRYKLLRTLELQGTRITRLSSDIQCLVCLRYLGLRGTQLEFLPANLWRLRHLMCLDIRDTGISQVNGVFAFKEMRHLYLANSFRDQSVLIKEGLPSLVHLQTLSGVACQGPSEHRSLEMIPFEQQLLYLKLLRKLSIKKVSSESCEHICDAINRMEFLKSLTITRDEGDRDEGQFDISSLKIKNNLRKLKLGGDMGRFFLLEPRMQSITYLYLWDSKLPEDPLYHLRGLQQLLLLSLCNAYTGERMSSGNGGYRKLKKLSIISMENVDACIFGKESMRNLAELVFARCNKLRTRPEGLGHLNSLREVHQAQMPEQFCRETKDCLSKKYVRVREFQMHFHASSRATV